MRDYSLYDKLINDFADATRKLTDAETAVSAAHSAVERASQGKLNAYERLQAEYLRLTKTGTVT